MLYTKPEHTAKTILNQVRNIRDSQALYFRKFAEELISKNPSIKPNSKQELTYLFNQLKSFCRYTLEPEDIETLKTPLGIIRNLYNYGYLVGDCDDMTMFSALILYFLGYNIGTRIIKQNGENEYSHIYTVVNLDGEIVPFDLCCNSGCGREITNKTGELTIWY